MEGLRVPTIDLDLAEAKEIPFGKGAIRVVETPGHTPGGVTFLLAPDRSRGETADRGFFGDSLFHLSVGRTDLGGDPCVYEETIRDVILAMPDETEVHSGHGPSTTIGVERRENPFLNGQLDLGCPDVEY
jgi:glyoxylase-like metal-dependent hydrolase (beta-lactamase superfamily II)